MVTFSAYFRKSAFLLGLLLVLPVILSAQNQKLTFEDIMKWEDISDTEISANGEWMTYSVWPDRGDGEVRVRSVDGETLYTIELGDNPAITRNGAWVGAYLQVPMADQLNENDDDQRQGLALLNTANGNSEEIENVRSFTFSNDGNWAAIHRFQSEEIEEIDHDNDELGTELTLRNLSSGSEMTIPFVSEVAIDSTSTYLVYSVVDTSGTENGLYARDLSNGADTRIEIHQEENGFYDHLEWDDHNQRLAFVGTELDEDYEPGDANIYLWDTGNQQPETLVEHGELPDEWALRSNNDLDWTRHGDRLFFGIMDQQMVDLDESDEAEADTSESVEVYDMEAILSEKEVDVWHWDDPQIKTHEKQTWNSRKNHLYRAVYHIDDNEWVQLADKDVPDAQTSEDNRYTLASSDLPYQKLRTWDGTYRDYYLVDLHTGEKQQFLEKLGSWASLSPEGNFAIYYEDKNWHLYNIEDDVYTNLTEDLNVPFYDEDHDRPNPPSGYGVAGWMEGDDAVLIYDKYDIWKFSTGGQDRQNLTEDGRERELTYRIEQLDWDKRWFNENDKVLLEGYYDKKKTYAFYTMQFNNPGTVQRLEEPKRFDVITRPEDTDRIFYTREAYDEYPNIWMAENMDFETVDQITELHTDLHDTYNWGTAELIEWKSLDGLDLQGALIKPDNFEEGKKYPVLIYFYRFFSQRAYEFNSITNDTRPTFPQWISDDYIIFLPDIRFDIGQPGFASTKSLVPGVQKLIEMGIADPDKLGLHGHSWSGYQTAFIITQTDIFDAAIAGAPVSNMTSAYSGIRWGSGLARQFQYEQTQSRIGGSLWEYPELYIENSPVFYADRIETPLLMMFGDEDTAVPWYQGIEMYLAMRRLEKDAVFLQYRGEPHHLREYANRLDYAIKMKEYFDHYLKGTEGPEWIEEGVPYRGN